MNTELLREDELRLPSVRHASWSDWLVYIDLLRQRLIETREKNASLQKTYDVYSEGCAARIDELEAELAEALKALGAIIVCNSACEGCMAIARAVTKEKK